MCLPVQNRSTLEVAIAKLVDAETQSRRDHKTEMYIETSKMRYHALIEDIICGDERNLSRDDIAA